MAFRPQRVAVLQDKKGAEVLFGLNLTTSDGRAIDAKLFTKNRVEDIDTVHDLEKAIHQVGPGTGRRSLRRGHRLRGRAGRLRVHLRNRRCHGPDVVMNEALRELSERFMGISGDLEKAWLERNTRPASRTLMDGVLCLCFDDGRCGPRWRTRDLALLHP